MVKSGHIFIFNASGTETMSFCSSGNWSCTCLDENRVWSRAINPLVADVNHGLVIVRRPDEGRIWLTWLTRADT